MRHIPVLVVLLSVACSKGESPPSAAMETQSEIAPEAEQAPVETNAEPGKPVQPSIAPPSIRVLTTGAPPHRPLRWELQKGSTETLEIRSTTTTTTEQGSAARPPVVLTMTVEAKETEANGMIRVALEVTDVKVLATPSDQSPKQLEGLKNWVGRMKGKTGTYLIDSQGIASALHLDAKGAEDAGAQELLQQILYRTTVPVPREELGQGAQWTVERVDEKEGLLVKELSTFELTKVEGSRVELALKMKTTRRPQNTRDPGAAVGQNVTVVEAESETTGAGTWDLTRLVPLSSKTETATETSMLVQVGDGSTRSMQMRSHSVQLMTRK